MPAKIDFRIKTSGSTFLHPGKAFEAVTERFEVRMDPLTGRTGHVSHVGAVKAQKLPLDTYGRPEVKGFCPFCLENRDRVTPKFVPEFIPEGRLSRNEAVIIPNLFPYDIYNGLAIMTDDHVVPLEALNEVRLMDAFSLGIDFLKRIRSVSPSLPFHIMTWNYMPPSGGGLVHPHQQYFATEHPGNQFSDELKASKGFYDRYGSGYWSAFVQEEERLNVRYIAAIGHGHWLSSFVPMGLLGDLQCIFPGVFSIDEVTENHVHDLVSGLLKLFPYFKANDIFSFNASLFFGPSDQDYFSCHFRITPRTFLNTRDYASDLNFFPALLAEPVSVVAPEDLCVEVKKFFL
jgi:UDPglucose--hexose-1-phosphate uridylyltransferase